MNLNTKHKSLFYETGVNVPQLCKVTLLNVCIFICVPK